MAAGVGVEPVDEVGVQAAVLQAASGVRGEQRAMRFSRSSDWLPSDSLRAMTDPRRARSAWLLVGCTPVLAAKVHGAGQIFSRFLAKARLQR